MPYADPEKYKEYQRNYGKRNRKRLNMYSLQYYYKTNRKEYLREVYHNNIEEYRLKRGENARRRRREILEILGGSCVKCGFTDPRALHIDHVNGGGSKERKTYGHSPSALLRKVRESLDSGKHTYQILCANCNYIKRSENKEMFR